MKQFILSLMLLVGVATLAQATVKAPTDFKGNTLPTVDWVGATPCTIYNNTASECFTGAGMVYGVVVSSDAGQNFVVLRDSNTANTSSSSFTFVNANGNGANANGAGTTQVFKFPVPVSVTNGLSANLSLAPLTGGQWMILYRKLSAPEN